MANVNHDQLAGSDLHDNKVYPATGTPLPAWTQTDARYPQQTRTIATAGPLTGGGNLSADRALSLPAATTAVDGYLKATDWQSFSQKQPRTYITVGPSGSVGNDYTGTSPGDVAIVAAIAAVSGTGGGIVFIRAGDYTIPSANLPIVVPSNVSIIGEGRSTHLQATGTTNQPIFVNSSRTTGGNSWITFANLWLDKNQTAGFPSDNPVPAIRFDGVSNCTVQNVRFSYGGVQFRPLLSYGGTATNLTNGNNRYNTVTDCFFENNNIISIVFSQGSHNSAINNRCFGYDSPIAILGAWDDVLILGNQIYSQSTAGQGIEANQDPGQEKWQDLSIIGNYTKGAFNNGIQISGAETTDYVEGVTIQGNTIVNPGYNGIMLNQNVKGFDISGNRVVNPGRAGISLTSDTVRISQGTVSNNHIRNAGQTAVQTYGIYLLTTTNAGTVIEDVAMHHNRIYDTQGSPTTTQAIRVQTSAATDSITYSCEGNNTNGIAIAFFQSGSGTMTGSSDFRGKLSVTATIPKVSLVNASQEWMMATNYQNAASFSLIDVTAGNVQRLLVDESGNLGVGTPTPKWCIREIPDRIVVTQEVTICRSCWLSAN